MGALQGLQGRMFQGIKNSRPQDLKASRPQGFKAPGPQGQRALRRAFLGPKAKGVQSRVLLTRSTRTLQQEPVKKTLQEDILTLISYFYLKKNYKNFKLL